MFLYRWKSSILCCKFVPFSFFSLIVVESTLNRKYKALSFMNLMTQGRYYKISPLTHLLYLSWICMSSYDTFTLSNRLWIMNKMLHPAKIGIYCPSWKSRCLLFFFPPLYPVLSLHHPPTQICKQTHIHRYTYTNKHTYTQRI